MISLIAGVDKNFLIGNNNTLPWGRIPADMKYFKETTTGKTIVMGRKTFASIGKALPNRENLILTRDAGFQAENCTVINSTDEVLKINTPDKEIFIIGGAEIYKIFLPYADRLYLTFIDGEFTGDTYFPVTDLAGWKKVKETISDNLNFSVFEK